MMSEARIVDAEDPSLMTAKEQAQAEIDKFKTDECFQKIYRDLKAQNHTAAV